MILTKRKNIKTTFHLKCRDCEKWFKSDYKTQNCKECKEKNKLKAIEKARVTRKKTL